MKMLCEEAKTSERQAKGRHALGCARPRAFLKVSF